MTLTQFDKKGNRIEFGRTSPGLPWCMTVNPQDIVVPWGTVDLETAPWIAHRNISYGTYHENTRVLYNEIWEICDRSDNTIKVICFDYDKYLRDEVDAIQVVCGTPYISGTFVLHPRFFWSTPLAHYLGRLQKKEFDI